MTADLEYKTTRIAEYSARNFLIAQGYEVVRVAHRHNRSPVPFHLIAWKDPEGIFFIRVRKAQTRRTLLSLQDELRYLTGLVSTRRYPGDFQYWIRDADHWTRYRIFSGGSVLITGAGCDLR